jgi:endonuclease YncB( thermonuclease family)
MGKLLQFWQKDIINKLIVMVLLLIIVVMGFQIYFLAGTSEGKAILANLIPTPTLSVAEIFKKGAATTTAAAELTRTAIPPTITSLPFTPMVRATSPLETPTASRPIPSATRRQPTATARSTVTPPPLALKTLSATPTATPTLTSTSRSGSCLPNKVPQVGKVMDIISGTTVRVMIGDLMYVVRYLGVVAPVSPNFAQLGQFQNGQMVYLKNVKLYAEDIDKDESSRLLRYVVVGDSTLVNQELILRGLATAATSSYGCSAEFSASEQYAKANQIGLWQIKQP